MATELIEMNVGFERHKLMIKNLLHFISLVCFIKKKEKIFWVWKVPSVGTKRRWLHKRKKKKSVSAGSNLTQTALNLYLYCISVCSCPIQSSKGSMSLQILLFILTLYFRCYWHAISANCYNQRMQQHYTWRGKRLFSQRRKVLRPPRHGEQLTFGNLIPPI